jgi:TonB family protein
MFESIAGAGKSQDGRRRIALAAALGLHAAVIGGALLARRMQPELETTPDTVFTLRPPAHRSQLTGDHGRTVEAIASAAPGASKPRKHPFKPRANPAEPASVPVEPEQIAAATAPADVAPSSDAPASSGPLGDAGSGPSSDDPALPEGTCPQGAVCDSSSGDPVLSFNSSMLAPRANCSPPRPLVPYAAQRFELEGRVIAQYVVHADGRADSVNILNADAPPMFAESVRDWLAQCNFTPAMVEGAPRSVRMVQAFHFKPR